MSSRRQKRNVQPATASIKPQPPSDGFQIITDTEARKIARRDAELKAAEHKLMLIHRADRAKQSAKQPEKVALSNPPLNLHNYASAMQSYVQALICPFDVRGIKIPSLVPLPTSTFSVREIHDFDLVDATGAGKFRLLAPCNFKQLWAASGPGTDSTTVTDSTTEGHLYWNGTTNVQIPAAGATTLKYKVGGGLVTSDRWALEAFQTARNYYDIIELYSMTRQVSGGIRVSYNGKVFDSEGRVAIAILPPGSWPPYPNSTATGGTYMGGATGFDMTFEAVSKLPGARVVPANTPFEIPIVPYDSSCEEWCPTSFIPYRASANVHYSFLGRESCPPCTEDPEGFYGRMSALDGASQAASTSTIAETLMVRAAFNEMGRGSGVFGVPVVVYENVDPTASITVEFVANYEAIPATRTFSMIQADHSDAHGADVREAARHVARRMAGPHKVGIAQRLGALLKKAVRQGAQAIGSSGITMAANRIATALGASEGAADAIAAGATMVGDLML